MATRRRTSQRRRASLGVIDLTCEPDSDSEGEVLIVGESGAPAAAPSRAAAPPREPDSPVAVVGMVVDQTPHLLPRPASPPPPPLAATDYPRNPTEALLETELSDIAIDVRLLQQNLREHSPRGLRPDLERRLRELRHAHGRLQAQVGQLTAGRRLRFEGLVRPLSAELDEVWRLLAVSGPQRDAPGPVRTRRSIAVDDSPPLPPDLPPSPPRASPAPASPQPDRSPASPAEAPGGLQCPVCFESVARLKEQHRGFLVTRCGHWFCEPCLKGACQVRRECPICRAKLRSRPPYRPLYL